MNRVFAHFFLLIILGLYLLTNCNTEKTDKNDPESIKAEERQEQQIKEERDDTTGRANPIYEASLEETNESKDDTQASGSLTIALQDDSIHIKGKFWGLTSDYTETYIHEVLQSNRVLRLEPSVGDDKKSGTFESSVKIDKSTREKLQGDSLYISIYSTKYENTGEISGQLTAREVPTQQDGS